MEIHLMAIILMATILMAINPIANFTLLI